MASKGPSPTPNTNEKIKLSIATEVRTEDSHWVRPEEIAQGQADALWKVIDHNNGQLKPGTVEISQGDDFGTGVARVSMLMYGREAQHNSENDPRDHLACCNKYNDGTTSTEHYPIPKDEKSDDKSAKKSSEKKPEKAGKKK